MVCIKGSLLQIDLKGMLATCLPRPSSPKDRIIDTAFLGRCKEAVGGREDVPVAEAAAMSAVPGTASLGSWVHRAIIRGDDPASVDEALPLSGLRRRSYGEAAGVLAAVSVRGRDDPGRAADKKS